MEADTVNRETRALLWVVLLFVVTVVGCWVGLAWTTDHSMWSVHW